MHEGLDARTLPGVNATSKTSEVPAGPITLGELLYADPGVAAVSEGDWLALVRAIAASETSAMRALFETTYPILFAYLMQLTHDLGTTQDVILDVFEDVWCEAPVYDASHGPVLGWIMRRARSLALARAQGGTPIQRGPGPVPELSSLLHATNIGEDRRYDQKPAAFRHIQASTGVRGSG